MRSFVRFLVLVSVLIAGLAPAAGQDGFTIGQFEGEGAIFRNGQLYAFPLAAPVDFVLLDDGTLILMDNIVGVVAIGGRAGEDPEQPGLAARQELVGIPDGRAITRTGFGDELAVVSGEGGLFVIDPAVQGFVDLTFALRDPIDVRAVADGLVVTEADGALVFVDYEGGLLPLDGLDDPRGVAPGPGGRPHVCDYAAGVVAVPDEDGVFVPVAEVPAPTRIVGVPEPDAPGDAPAETLLIVSDPDEQVEGDEEVFVVVTEFDDPAGSLIEADELPTYVVAPAPQIPVAAVLEPAQLDPVVVDEVVEELFGDRAIPAPATTTSTTTEAPADDTEAAAPSDADLETAVDETPADGSVAADGSDDGPWWVLLLLIPFALAGVLTILLARRRAGARPPQPDVDPPPAQSIASAPMMAAADPCADEIRAAEAAEAACASATAEAEAAEGAADDAATTARDLGRVATDAAAAAKAKADILAVADAALDPGSSYAEDDRGRITSGDLALKDEASKAAYARYQAGELSAGELEAEWDRLGDRGAIDELRRAAAARRDEAKAEADQAAEAAADAKRAADDAQAQADAARAAATDARAAADAACADATAARAAADECLGREAERQAAEAEAEALAAEDAARRAAEDAADEERDETDDEPRDEPASQQQEPEGCPCGTWYIYGSMVGGTAVFWGTETHKFWAVCTCNSGVWIEFVTTTTRWGIGLGGEGGAIAGFATGFTVAEVQSAVAGALLGVSGDLSLGVSGGAVVKSAAKGGKLKEALQAASRSLKGVEDGVSAATKLKASDAQAVGQAVQQTDGVKALILPVSGLAAAGLQIGIWKATSTTVNVTAANFPGGGYYKGTKTFP
ncbi:MAG: hypothetical protein AAF081_10935 [Actinomycetota bacterium]